MTRIIALPQRRVAVVLQLVSFPLVFLVLNMAGISSSLASLLALIVLLMISTYLYYQTGLWQFGNAPAEQLDERQQLIRNQAYRSAYMVISVILVFIFFYSAYLVDAFGLPMPHGYDEVSPFFWSLFTVVIVLPFAILAWTETDG